MTDDGDQMTELRLKAAGSVYFVPLRAVAIRRTPQKSNRVRGRVRERGRLGK